MFDNDERVDRRIRRTRDRLGDALIELLKDKGFDAFTVQDVLDRAQVARSTFYAHYRGKEDLFLSDLEEFFEAMGSLIERSRERSRRVMAVRELFSHIADSRKLYDAMVASGRIDDYFALAQGCFARGIEARLRVLAPDADEPRLRATALSGALLSLLRQWLQRANERSADEMDAFFHSLVWI
jgi:AcrR family transcriptional regulator